MYTRGMRRHTLCTKWVAALLLILCIAAAQGNLSDSGIEETENGSTVRTYVYGAEEDRYMTRRLTASQCPPGTTFLAAANTCQTCSLAIANCKECTSVTSCLKCKAGYRATGGACEEVDECADGSHPCSEHATCTNTKGSYRCTCNRGYTGDPLDCRDMNECHYDNGGCEFMCTNTQASFYCSCGEGFKVHSNKKNCTDINECFIKTHNCDKQAECTNTRGSFTCHCSEGYAGLGTRKKCDEIDMCKINNGGCLHTCTKIPGTYVCSCNTGYQLADDGKGCRDEDECAADFRACPQHSTCTNVIGSYTCNCNRGYTGDNTACNDIDECANGTHTCSDMCANTMGSFLCRCKKGYLLLSNNATCRDIDECEKDFGGCKYNCINNNGSYECTCAPGYALEKDRRSCADLNECRKNMHTCHVNAFCTNTLSSFMCGCKTGYNGDGVHCNDINECAGRLHTCSDYGLCTNSLGSFKCECNAGYLGDGVVCKAVRDCQARDNGGCQHVCKTVGGVITCFCNEGFRLNINARTCDDIDECTYNRGGCQMGCNNTLGSYHCTCKPGYKLAQDNRCQDVDECTLKTHDCDRNATCTNMIGSFLCQCNSGYDGDGLECLAPDECGQASMDWATIGRGSKVVCSAYVGNHTVIVGIETRVEGNAIVDDGCEIINTTVGRYVRIGPNCKLTRSFLGDRSSLGMWVFMTDTVIGEDNMIDHNSTFSNCTLGRGILIGQWCNLTNVSISDESTVGNNVTSRNSTFGKLVIALGNSTLLRVTAKDNSSISADARLENVILGRGALVDERARLTDGILGARTMYQTWHPVKNITFQQDCTISNNTKLKDVRAGHSVNIGQNSTVIRCMLDHYTTVANHSILTECGLGRNNTIATYVEFRNSTTGFNVTLGTHSVLLHSELGSNSTLGPSTNMTFSFFKNSTRIPGNVTIYNITCGDRCSALGPGVFVDGNFGSDTVLGAGCKTHNTTTYSNVTFGGNCKIISSQFGSHTVLGTSTSIFSSAVGRWVVIGTSAIIKNSVVGSMVVVGENALVDGSQVGDNVSMEEKSKAVDTSLEPGVQVLEGSRVGVDLSPAWVGDIGQGSGVVTHIGRYSVVGAAVRLGRGTVVASNVTIGTDSQILNNVTIRTLTNIGSNNLIGARAYVGQQVNLGHDVTVGSDTVIEDYFSSAQQLKMGARNFVGLNGRVGERNTFGDSNFIKSELKAGSDVSIGKNNTFGRNVTVGDHVTIGDNNIFPDNAVVTSHTEIGDNHNFNLENIPQFIFAPEKPQKKGLSAVIIACIVIGTILLALCLTCVAMVCWRKQREKSQWQKLPQEFAEDYYLGCDLPEQVSVRTELAAIPGPLKKVVICKDEIIGAGAFGNIWICVLYHKKRYSAVAVKQVCIVGADGRGKLMEEVERAKLLTHPNVVGVVGMLEEEPEEPLCFVLEYMPLGSLSVYMENLAESGEDLSSREQMWYGLQVAQAMTYLASKEVVHQALCAAHCMLTLPNDQSFGMPVLKLSHFALSNQIRARSYAHSKLPGLEVRRVSHLSMETITSEVHSTEGDVWAYGVTLWEIFTGGETPWDGKTGQEILHALMLGERLPRPDSASQEIYNLMKHCWMEYPSDRPTFSEISRRLAALFIESCDQPVGWAMQNGQVTLICPDGTAPKTAPNFNSPSYAMLGLTTSNRPITVPNEKPKEEVMTSYDRDCLDVNSTFSASTDWLTPAPAPTSGGYPYHYGGVDYEDTTTVSTQSLGPYYNRDTHESSFELYSHQQHSPENT